MPDATQTISLTPTAVADSYVHKLLGPEVLKAGGKDGRLTSTEAETNEYVKSAYEAAGEDAPALRSVIEAGRKTMLEEAERVKAGNGFVSSKEAAKMSPLMAHAFHKVCGKIEDPAELASHLEELAKNLTYGYGNVNRDDHFTACHVELDPSKPFDEASLRAALDFEIDNPSNTYTNTEFHLETWPFDHFWECLPYENAPAETQAECAKVDQEMKAALLPQTAIDTSDERSASRTAKIWVVTPSDVDANRAPLYVIGRTPAGDIVGFKTHRTWT